MLRNVLTWIIHLPDLILDIFLINHDAKRLKEYAQTPFVCPNCGTVFFAKWYHLWRGKDFSLAMVKKAKLKCPHCKEKDMCRWISEE